MNFGGCLCTTFLSDVDILKLILSMEADANKIKCLVFRTNYRMATPSCYSSLSCLQGANKMPGVVGQPSPYDHRADIQKNCRAVKSF